MESIQDPTATADRPQIADHQTPDASKATIRHYYEDTGLDYGEWSKEYNMHFGYWRPWMNPFRREPMLQSMNHYVFEQLHITEADEAFYDLGCGLGATMRSFAKQYPSKRIKGVTLVQWQIAMAQQLNADAHLDHQISLLQADYLNTPIPAASADAAYALESCCHSPGEDKGLFLEEMHRILKPGGRFVIVDGFTKRPRQDFNPLFRRCLDSISEGWAVPCFPSLQPFLAKLESLGFTDVKAEEIVWRVAPSVLHSPFCVTWFILKKLVQGERLNRVRLGHLKSCLLALLVGMHRGSYGYFVVSGRK
jgi:MPBQ/MSBQ methyltransferase